MAKRTSSFAQSLDALLLKIVDVESTIHVLQVLGRLLDNEALKTFNPPFDLMLKIDRLEDNYTKLLMGEGIFDEARLPVLWAVVLGLITDARRASGALERDGACLVVVLDDLDALVRDYSKFKNGQYIPLEGGGSIRIDSVSLREIAKNLKTSTAYYKGKVPAEVEIVNKRHVHNNHLARLTLEDPELFMGGQNSPLVRLLKGRVQWEKKITLSPEMVLKTTSKRPDNVLRCEISGFSLDDGDLLAIEGPNELHVLYDSKVYKNGIEGIKGAYQQQVEFFIADRFEDTVLPLFKGMKSKGVSDSQKQALLEEILPASFLHFIFVPSDFPDLKSASATGMHQSYVTKMKAKLEQKLTQLKGNPDLTSDDADAIKEILEAHIDDHYGNGKYILDESEMTYAFSQEVLAE
jgi:hypothetical protein